MATRPPAEGLDRDRLDEVALLTRMMRGHSEEIEKIGQRRREILHLLRQNDVTFREIAEAMGSTEQAVYKSLNNIPTASVTKFRCGHDRSPENMAPYGRSYRCKTCLDARNARND